MSVIEIKEDLENKLLGRRELLLKFSAGSGLLSRQGAVEAISSKLGVSKESVSIISIFGGSGKRDCYAQAFVFSTISNMKKQLPDYFSLRHLAKEDRKKAREEKKKGKAPVPQQKKAESTVSPAEDKKE